LESEDDGSSADAEIDGKPVLSGVATSESGAGAGDEAFSPNDEVVITMHVNIPDVVPVQTKLKTVSVEMAGSGNSHVLFDSYSVTHKGAANNLVHSASDDTTDSTTFRLASLVLDMPENDPVFPSDTANSNTAYTIYSQATVEYLTSGSRRMSDVSTIRSSPAKRALSTHFVRVDATTLVMVSTEVDGQAAANNGGSGAQERGSNLSTVIIIGVGAFMGTAFVIAGTVFLVKSRWMKSEAATVPTLKAGATASQVFAPVRRDVSRALEAKEPASAPAPVPVRSAAAATPAAPKAVRAMAAAASAAAEASEVEVDLDEVAAGSGAAAPAPSAPRRSRSSSKSRRVRGTSEEGSNAASEHRKLRKAKRTAKAAPPAAPASPSL
jgi:hypothetical protein